MSRSKSQPQHPFPLTKSTPTILPKPVPVVFPPDVQAELDARLEWRTERLLERPDADPRSLRIRARHQHEEYVVARRAPCYDPEYKGPCRDPRHCQIEKHADKGRWISAGVYVRSWITELLAPRIGAGAWRWIRFATGPGRGDDPQSLEDMVATAGLFRKVSGFKWNKFLGGRRDQRRATDYRFIKVPASRYLLEGRVYLEPPPPQEDVRESNSNHALGGWRVCWDFLYYGPEPPEADAERLTRRWAKHQLNRGRAGVRCTVEPVRRVDGALHQIQAYDFGRFRLTPVEQVKLERLRGEWKLIRIIRLGRGRGRKQFAKRWWAEALAEATREAYANPDPRQAWSRWLNGLDPETAWEAALGRLEAHDVDRTSAHRWRWHRRWELYTAKLRQLAAPPSIRPSDFTHDAPVEPEAAQLLNEENDVKAENLMTRSELRAELERALAPVHAKLDALLDQLRRGEISADEFERRSRKLLGSRRVQ